MFSAGNPLESSFSATSSQALVSSPASALAPPGNFLATPLSDSEIGFSWTPSAGASGYRLYESTSTGLVSPVGQYGPNATSAVAINLTSGVTYAFDLVAFNGSQTAATPWLTLSTNGSTLVAPQDFTASTIASDQITFSWSASNGATQYQLYTVTDGQPRLVSTYDGSATSATVIGLSSGTAYPFDLVAMAGGQTAATPWLSVTTTSGGTIGGTSGLTPPTDFTGTPISDTAVSFNWGAASGSQGYRLYEFENGQPTLVASYTSGVTSATLTGLSAGITYAFDLVAFNGDQVAATPWISVAANGSGGTGSLSPPGNFTAVAVSGSQVSFNWSTSQGATSYELLELINGQLGPVATYGANAINATLGGLQPNTTYSFELVATNGSQTAASPLLTVTTQSAAGVLTPPTNFAATPLSSTQVGLSWGASAGAQGYRLYESINGRPTLVATYPAGTSSAVMSNLTPNTSYIYNLQAFSGSSLAATPWISVTTEVALTAPGNFTATAISNTQINLSWTAAAGTTGYRLYESQSGQPTLIATYDANTTAVTIGRLNSNTTYAFNLVAFNPVAIAATPWVAATTSSGPLQAPAEFIGAPLSGTNVTLSWSTAANATGYQLYQIIGGQPALIGTFDGNTTSTTVNALQPNTTYSFNLVAFNSAQSAATRWINVTTTF